MRAWIIMAALLLAATPAVAQTTPVAAPIAEGAVRVSASQSGQTVEAAAGAAIAIELQANSSARTGWFVVSRPDFLAAPQTLSGPTITSARPMVGAPRWQVFVFPVTEAGQGDLVLEKRGGDGAVLETFTVTIIAQ